MSPNVFYNMLNCVVPSGCSQETGNNGDEVGLCSGPRRRHDASLTFLQRDSRRHLHIITTFGSDLLAFHLRHLPAIPCSRRNDTNSAYLPLDLTLHFAATRVLSHHSLAHSFSLGIWRSPLPSHQERLSRICGLVDLPQRVFARFT